MDKVDKRYVPSRLIVGLSHLAAVVVSSQLWDALESNGFGCAFTDRRGFAGAVLAVYPARCGSWCVGVHLVRTSFNEWGRFRQVVQAALAEYGPVEVALND